jgi:hypothetical protein
LLEVTIFPAKETAHSPSQSDHNSHSTLDIQNYWGKMPHLTDTLVLSTAHAFLATYEKLTVYALFALRSPTCHAPNPSQTLITSPLTNEQFAVL